MAKPLLPDDLWELARPLLPAPRPRRFRFPGRRPVDDRTCLTGILFVLKTGIGWEDFPSEMGCCGMTLLNRLREWQAAGVWQALHELLLAKLRDAGQIDFARVVVDSSSVRAVHGGKKRGRAPWTGRSAGASTTWPWTRAASRSPARSRAPTRTT
jgi:transposase